jgi:hypothetical protein
VRAVGKHEHAPDPSATEWHDDHRRVRARARIAAQPLRAGEARGRQRPLRLEGAHQAGDAPAPRLRGVPRDRTCGRTTPVSGGSAGTDAVNGLLERGRHLLARVGEIGGWSAGEVAERACNVRPVVPGGTPDHTPEGGAPPDGVRGKAQGAVGERMGGGGAWGAGVGRAHTRCTARWGRDSPAPDILAGAATPAEDETRSARSRRELGHSGRGQHSGARGSFAARTHPVQSRRGPPGAFELGFLRGRAPFPCGRFEECAPLPRAPTRPGADRGVAVFAPPPYCYSCAGGLP